MIENSILTIMCGLKSQLSYSLVFFLIRASFVFLLVRKVIVEWRRYKTSILLVNYFHVLFFKILETDTS